VQVVLEQRSESGSIGDVVEGAKSRVAVEMEVLLVFDEWRHVATWSTGPIASAHDMGAGSVLPSGGNAMLLGRVGCSPLPIGSRRCSGSISGHHGSATARAPQRSEIAGPTWRSA
jgi:hypothetical protein